MRLPSVVCAVIGAALLVVPASAHHSSTSYEMNRILVLEGTVKQLLVLNPHTFFYFEVKDDKGQVVTWVGEAVSAASLKKKGFQATDFRAGDPIRVRCMPLVDGSPGCHLGWVTPLHGDMARGPGLALNMGM